jgi:hydrogenase nickel incorporation protein HypA/HybF
VHEMSIALSVVAVASAAVPSSSPPRLVEAVSLEVGRLTAVVPDSLRRCFDAASRGTAVEGATLRIEVIEVVVGCRACGEESEQTTFPFTCPSCGSQRVDIVCGRELRVSSIEVAER